MNANELLSLTLTDDQVARVLSYASLAVEFSRSSEAYPKFAEWLRTKHDVEITEVELEIADVVVTEWAAYRIKLAKTKPFVRTSTEGEASVRP